MALFKDNRTLENRRSSARIVVLRHGNEEARRESKSFNHVRRDKKEDCLGLRR